MLKYRIIPVVIMNERLLEEIGLTKGEITVYMTLLKTGETTTGGIIKDAGISSGKIYEILDKLISKGLASYIIKEKTKHFSAASPKRILDYLHEKENALRKKGEEFSNELPNLIAMEQSGKREYETMLFRGFRGIQTAIFEALQDLTDADETMAMGVMSSKNEKYNIMWRKWHSERAKRKIKCKCLFSDKGTSFYKLMKRTKLTEVRVLNGVTPSAVDIMGRRVLIFTYGDEPSCLSVKNPEIAQSFRTFFYNLWKLGR